MMNGIRRSLINAVKSPKIVSQLPLAAVKSTDDSAGVAEARKT